MKTRVTWDCHFSGQKRAYADTTTEGVITFENTSYSLPDVWIPSEYVSEEHAKRVAKTLIGWNDEPDDGSFALAFEPRLRTFEKVGPGSWYVFVVRRYDD